MDYQAIRDEFAIEAELYRYNTLRRWLNYEGYSLLIWGGGFFAPIGLVAYGAALAAIVFVPIMIRELIAVRRVGWIVTWTIMVLIPTLLVYFLGPDKQRMYWTAFVFLPASYVYFWLLRMAVDTWTGRLANRLALRRGADS